MVWPILALDVGQRRTGVALCPTGSVVLSLPTIYHRSSADLLVALGEVIDKHQPSLVVLGQSRAPNSPQVEVTQALAERHPTLTVATVDETLTTKEAERQGSGRDSDAAAARLILEQFLRERSSKVNGQTSHVSQGL